MDLTGTTAQVTTTIPLSDGAPTTVPQSEGIPTLPQYLATIEHGLEGTGLEGAAFDEPESLIRTGVLFCDLLDEGLGPVDVLRGWVAALATDGRTPSEDDLLLGGVVLGSAVKFLCPEHLGDLELSRVTTGS
ncbi:MAG: DUF732 domain-containing protein [Acidimicrobiia bacterium]